jgi:hypothetical protein
MAGLEFDFIVHHEEPTCCYEGTHADSALETATALKGDAGFPAYDQNLVEYREERVVLAAQCEFATTGICALAQAGKLRRSPSAPLINE